MARPIQIAISVGEPAGIGPDLLIMLIQKQQEQVLVAFCDPNLLHQRAKILNLAINIILIDNAELINRQLSVAKPGSIYVLTTSHTKNKDYTAGILDDTTAASTLKHLEQATMACLHNYCDALVTCPIQKSIINHVDSSFIGHTEYLEQLCNQHYKQTPPFKSVMMLMSNDLKVALVTTHVPLIKVVENITKAKILEIATIIHQELKTKFKIDNPHIMLTGLNPHAGEDGKLGNEELNIITPAINQLKNKGIHATGPYAADSIFSKNLDSSALILAMYHDQGLTGFKARAFNTATNVTLGLPIIRTSVDHGTALDLAGTGHINLASLEFALRTAAGLACLTV